MEHIKEALTKANASLDDKPAKVRLETLAQSVPEKPVQAPQAESRPDERWAPRKVELDPKRMQRNRIVSFAMSDPNHNAVNILRTRVRKVLRDNRWKSLALTSPGAGCGKTMIALNLALSLARSPDCRVVLIDLDLRKPAIARTLGVEPTGSIGRFLQGNDDAKDCFVQVQPNLIVGLNAASVKESSELMQSRRMSELFSFVNSALAPDVILFDLPPIGLSDDTLAFLPRIDAALLIVAAGETTASEIDEAERQISHMDKLLGVVLNKSDDQSKDYYY